MCKEHDIPKFNKSGVYYIRMNLATRVNSSPLISLNHLYISIYLAFGGTASLMAIHLFLLRLLLGEKGVDFAFLEVSQKRLR